MFTHKASLTLRLDSRIHGGERQTLKYGVRRLAKAFSFIPGLRGKSSTWLHMFNKCLPHSMRQIEAIELEAISRKKGTAYY